MDFTITTTLAKRDYLNTVLRGFYKKPSFIIITLAGLINIAIALAYWNGAFSFSTDSSVFELILGVFFVCLPWISIFLVMGRQFDANPSLRSEITYHFNDIGFSAQGLTFKAEYSWVHITKQKEIGKFLILYHTKKSGNFIDKSALTDDQLQFIKGQANKYKNG